MIKLFVALLSVLAVQAQAKTIEACMVVEQLGSSFDTKTSMWSQSVANSYDLADDVSKELTVPLKLIKNLTITLSAGPGMNGSTSHKTYAVAADILDATNGTKTTSWALIINDTGADKIGSNIGAIQYIRPNHDVIQINCAAVDR